MAEYYDARAPLYDATAGYDDPVAEELRAPMKERFRRLLEDRKVLEIACGTGYWTEVIAQTAGSVLTTDVNPSMMAIASERLHGFPNFELMVAEAYVLEGVSGGFDAAFAHWW
ncbi:class I SAM-dependent methyltransferase [Candidatus Fermentibacterales bacterium]|nr:class I SAM-dependent methyltransferase [Candidatus Fermentibacterales bacterium]